MKKINLNGAKKVHFIGIGGISMSGLAEVLKRDGYEVTGSDSTSSHITDHLVKAGIPVAIPNSAENITDDIDMVVYTAAVRPENPEFQASHIKGKILIERAALLGIILEGYEHAICIAGSHGKTTATSLMAEIVLDAGLDPTISIGGHMGRDGTNYRVGESSYFVLESCEFRNQFHHFHPQVGIILNIDADHLDFFGSFENVVGSFKKFAENIRPGGVLVVQHGMPGFDEAVNSTGPKIGPVEFTANLPCKVITFGETEGDFRPTNVEYDNFGRPKFDIIKNNKVVAHVNLPLPGKYNMLNAIATFAAAYELGISPTLAANALSNVKGVKRRFEHKGVWDGAHIIDDYAHHPTEIMECLAAARKATQGKLFCLFQPHTYTRTRNHLTDFADSLKNADKIILLPIYAAREPFDPSISSLNLQEAIKDRGGDVIHFNDFDGACKFLQANLSPGDLLITMGAGDVYFVGEMLLST